MNKLFLILIVLIFGISCSSNEVKKEVRNDAAEVAPITNPNYQYDRAIAMIDANPDLSQTQKQKLDELIKKYAAKMYTNKEKESQYKTVLLEEMMKNDENNIDSISAAKKNIKQLDKENAKGLESFVDEFKAIVGKSAHNHQPAMMEVIMVE